MSQDNYQPIYEITRGETVESVHYGAIAVVNARGELITSLGNPELITFLRSAAKPFQLIPFLEAGAQKTFNLTNEEIALLCASHSGTNQHINTLVNLQYRLGVKEADLLCGVHYPYDEPTATGMRQRGEIPSPNQHNCSGKHTAMVGYARMHNWSTGDYIHPTHPVQQNILRTLVDLSSISEDQVRLGIDGCSVPNFAIPLKNAALAFARLCDPSGLEPNRRRACLAISSAMVSHPLMVAGPGQFDTRLMETIPGRILSKGGAEGYQGIGVFPGTLGNGSPAIGIAIKIGDGDYRRRVRTAVTLELLRQLGLLKARQSDALAEFGPRLPIENWRKIVVGEARPCFTLKL